MKNKMKQSLKSELKNVRVSDDLKRRILAEAAQSRSPVKRKSFSIRPLAAAAAVVLVLGATAGIAMLRTEHPDLSATPLSSNNNQPGETWVWTSEEDGLYHWTKACGELSGMSRTKPEDARLSGRKACSACYGDGNKAEELVWMTQHGSVYHAEPDCSGMEGAIGVLEIEAKTLGRLPCGICLDGETIETWSDELQATLPPRLTPSPMATYMPAQATPEPTIPPTMTVAPMAEEQTPRSTPEPFVTLPSEESFDASPTAAPTMHIDGPTAVWTTEQVDGPTAVWPTPQPTPMAEVVYGAEGEIVSIVSYPVETAAPTEVPEEMRGIVWTTDGGWYYHADEHCGGMEGATAVTEKEAQVVEGKIPCDVCMQRTVWTTENGTLWHFAQHCSGMVNAHKRVLEPCEVIDQERCPVCAMGEISVWMTENGTFYHWDEHCSGMMNAKQVCESEALTQNKQPCPDCLGELIVGNEAECIWMTDGGVYYHADEHCSGMQNAHACTVTDALSAGKSPCPTCSKQISEVWCTENGKYYHLDEHCSGMNGAHKCSGSEASAQGKTACPTCMQDVAQAVSGSVVRSESEHHAESEEHRTETEVHHSESEEHRTETEHHSESKEQHSKSEKHHD